MTILLDNPATTETVNALPLRVPRGLPRRRSWRERAVTGVAAVFSACCGPREQGTFGTLMYHRIANPVPGLSKPTWNVPPALLERQLAGLLARGWQAWPLSQVLTCQARELPIPAKTFVVTFDDGFVNNLTQALPILSRLHVPATLFLATAYLDSTAAFPSDDWAVAGQPGVPTDAWRPLKTDECRRLVASGLVELGAHTHTHADFRGRPAEFAADLAENLAVLEERFGVVQPAFAFPYGTVNDGFVTSELRELVREAGASCALSTIGAVCRPGDSPFAWGRFAAEDHDSAGTLAARLGGWTEAVRQLGKRVRP